MDFSDKIIVISGASGGIGKAMTSRFLEEGATVRAAENGALKRRQKAEDLIGTVIFLASDDSAFISGQTINVDGGRSFI
jgi:NAD(P)-dependent dehydrogenase (short-subunit alcohol dehydrogenase family)